MWCVATSPTCKPSRSRCGARCVRSADPCPARLARRTYLPSLCPACPARRCTYCTPMTRCFRPSLPTSRTRCFDCWSGLHRLAILAPHSPHQPDTSLRHCGVTFRQLPSPARPRLLHGVRVMTSPVSTP
ncbi:hypothetical protein GQ53DRAFT_371405 [Thozetella sp. PMI_491]|nr:hypothetical protein GQ53DRAFT_371405 [Thozetella sp. PMI_491]